MEFYEALQNRRTIRDFQPAPISDAVIARIISAAMTAPSNDHMRDWHFIVCTDPDTVRQLIAKIPKERSDAEIAQIFHDWNLQDPCQQRAYQNAIPKQYRMLAEASCVIVPLFLQKTDLLHPENLSHLNGFASIWCSIENLLLAAVAEHYATCLRIPLDNEAAWAQSVLNFPPSYAMPCYIAIGKPQPNAKIVEQKPFELSNVLHHNHW